MTSPVSLYIARRTTADKKKERLERSKGISVGTSYDTIVMSFGRVCPLKKRGTCSYNNHIYTTSVFRPVRTSSILHTIHCVRWTERSTLSRESTISGTNGDREISSNFTVTVSLTTRRSIATIPVDDDWSIPQSGGEIVNTFMWGGT